MSNLTSVKLLELLPPNLRKDPDMIAASAAADKEFQTLVGKIRNVMTFADIDNASSDVVNHLARELRVTWYDPSAPLAVRRELVKNSIIVHMTLGTPYAVELVIKDYFGSGVVQEWFEYGGDPFHFKVVSENSDITRGQEQRFLQALAKVKNLRSVLDEVVIPYLTWDMLDECDMTWDQMDALGLNWDTLPYYRPGRTVINNLLGPYGNMINPGGGLAQGWWAEFYEDLSCLNNVQTFTATATGGLVYRSATPAVQGNVYYVCGWIQASSNQVGLRLLDDPTDFTAPIQGTGDFEFVSIYETKTVADDAIFVGVDDKRATGFTPISMKKIHVVDLTADFGVGNIPTKAELDAYMANRDYFSQFVYPAN